MKATNEEQSKAHLQEFRETMTEELKAIKMMYETKLREYQAKVETMEREHEDARREAAREREGRESVLVEMAVRKRVEDELQETLSVQGREFKRAVDDCKLTKNLLERALKFKKSITPTLEGLVNSARQLKNQFIGGYRLRKYVYMVMFARRLQK